MSTLKDVFTLANLPSDIIRQLINLRPIEDIDSLQIISPRWNALSHEHLIRNRKNLPKIDWMILDFVSFSYIWLRFQCPTKYIKYLGINNSQLINRNNGKHKVDYIVNNDEILAARLKCFFDRISEIARLELIFDNVSSKTALEFVKIAMRGMIIGTVVIKGITSFCSIIDRSTILNFIRGNTVSLLIIFINDASEIGQGQSGLFFVDALQIAESVEFIAETADYEQWVQLRDDFTRARDRLVRIAELTASCTFGSISGAGGSARMRVEFLNRKNEG